VRTRWESGNERAAELSGVPVKTVQISVYVLSGICAAIAGLILYPILHPLVKR